MTVISSTYQWMCFRNTETMNVLIFAYIYIFFTLNIYGWNQEFKCPPTQIQMMKSINKPINLKINEWISEYLDVEIVIDGYLYTFMHFCQVKSNTKSVTASFVFMLMNLAFFNRTCRDAQLLFALQSWNFRVPSRKNLPYPHFRVQHSWYSHPQSKHSAIFYRFNFFAYRGPRSWKSLKMGRNCLFLHFTKTK